MIQKNRICHIVAYDAFDRDILISIIWFYTAAGFKCSYGKSPVVADLIVVLRGSPSAPIRYSQYTKSVHFYVYLAPTDAGHIDMLDSECVKLVVPSRSMISASTTLKDNISVVISLPPVCLQVWSDSVPQRDSDNRSDKLFHIGNLKAYELQNKESVFMSFVSFLTRNKIEVWGRNWDVVLAAENCRGYISMDDISDLYSARRASLGVMYSYQRRRSFSGRFFIGPLVGCAVFSECDLASSIYAPGVVSVDYANDDNVYSAIDNLILPSDLTELSRSYWKSSNFRLADSLEVSLGSLINMPSMRCSKAYDYFHKEKDVDEHQ